MGGGKVCYASEQQSAYILSKDLAKMDQNFMLFVAQFFDENSPGDCALAEQPSA